MATGLPGLGNPGRKALPYVAFSSTALCAAFHLSLPKLPARFPSRPKDQTRCGMSRVLPGPQRRSIRRTLSIETPQLVAAFVSNAWDALAMPRANAQQRDIPSSFRYSKIVVSVFNSRTLRNCKINVLPKSLVKLDRLSCRCHPRQTRVFDPRL